MLLLLAAGLAAADAQTHGGFLVQLNLGIGYTAIDSGSRVVGSNGPALNAGVHLGYSFDGPIAIALHGFVDGEIITTDAGASDRPGPGNAERGAAIYQSSGCASCHVVDGRGGILGPELTSIGSRRGSVYLRESVVTPAASHPPGYLVVRAVPASGPEVRGIRVNEDVFSILIRDAGGNVHTLQKSDLARVDRELEATLMPSYESRLSAAQLDDLVTYLATLRSAK